MAFRPGLIRVFAAAFALAFIVLGSVNPAAAQSGRVVLYNPGGAEIGEALVTAFRKRHPQIQVDLINAGVGELFTRIKAEARRPNGDVIIGASTESFQSDAALFEPYKTKEDADFPRDVVGPDNLYYGFNLLLQTFMVNTKMMPADQAPKSWKDLADPKFKGKILIANPSLSGSAYGQFAQLLQLYGWDVGAQVVANGVFLSSSELVWQNVAKGENAVGITGDKNVVSQAAAGFPVVAIYPSEGTALRFSANALIKNGPNPANGKLLADFVNSKEAHTLTVEVTSRRSVRKDVIAPKGQIATSAIKTFEYDDSKAAKERTANLKKFDDLLAAKK